MGSFGEYGGIACAVKGGERRQTVVPLSEATNRWTSRPQKVPR
jgi:hypothetical protein